MGKGNRNRELRIGDTGSVANNGAKLSKLQLIRKQERNDAIKRWATLICIIAIIVGIVLSLVITSVKKNNKLAKTISGTSENYEINNGMVAYLMYSEYNNLVNYYSSYLSSLGLDTSSSLSSQYPNSLAELYFGYQSSYTWADNFLANAISTLKQYVALAEEALDKGYSLDDDEKKSIDDTISSIKDAAKENGLTVNEYLSYSLTAGVKIENVRQCLELQALSSKYYTDLVDSYEFTEEEKQAYADENKSSFYTYSYLKYSYEADYEETADDDTKTNARNTAKDLADALLAKATSEEEFKKAIVELVKTAEASKETEDTSEENKEDTADKTDDDYLKDYTVADAAYSSTESDYNTWAFSTDRKAGDATVIADDEDTYTVYMITETLHLDTTKTRNVRHILIGATSDNTEEEIETAEAKAADILNTFNGGEKTEERFAELAKEYSTDTGSVDNGGLYEDVCEGDMVTEFNDWLFDTARQVGDTGVVKTDYGYHVMYYVGEGDESWKVDALSGLKSKKYSEDLTALETSHPITWDEDKLEDLI